MLCEVSTVQRRQQNIWLWLIQRGPPVQYILHHLAAVDVVAVRDGQELALRL